MRPWKPQRGQNHRAQTNINDISEAVRCGVENSETRKPMGNIVSVLVGAYPVTTGQEREGQGE